jgi:hypothetical protein
VFSPTRPVNFFNCYSFADCFSDVFFFLSIVYMKVMNKQPGHSSEPIISELDLTYKSRYSDHYIPDAYESLILDVIRGDHSNFVRYLLLLLFSVLELMN